MKQGVAILSMSHIPALHLVYIGMADGTIKAYSDQVEHRMVLEDLPDIITMLEPLLNYNDDNQITSSLLPVPSHVGPNATYELWVGQKNREITVLNAADLSIVDFLDSPQDKTPCPGYFTDLPFLHLACNIDVGEKNESQDDMMETESQDVTQAESHVVVYGALQFGQYLTIWDGGSKEILSCTNIYDFIPQWEGTLCGYILFLQWYYVIVKAPLTVPLSIFCQGKI